MKVRRPKTAKRARMEQTAEEKAQIEELLVFEQLALDTQELAKKQGLEEEASMMSEESWRLHLMMYEEQSFKEFFDKKLEEEIS